MSVPMQIRYRYVHEDRDRHGNVRVYFWRRPGAKIRMDDPPGSEAFAARYHALLSGEAPDAPASSDHRPRAGTLRWLVAAYVTSPAARGLDPETLRVRRRILEACCREPIAPGRSEIYADFPLDRLGLRALAVLRDRKSTAPEAANSRVRAFRAMCKWARAEGHMAADPARELTRLAPARSGGHRMWTPDDVMAFEARHPIGSTARLALAILLYTGFRRSDAVQLGRQHVRDGWISKPMHKGRARHAQRIEIPMLPELAATIAASRCGDLAYLATEAGQPFTIAGFGNWFRARCDEACLKGIAAHGLRKAGATRAAEAGASSQTLMAIFGWRSLAEAELYTRAADRKRLAREGMALLSVPTANDGADETAKKSL